MSDIGADAKPKGIFKRETKGQSNAPISVMVERGRIRFFAQVLGDIDPIHSDVEHARSKGHPDIVAPPSFIMSLKRLRMRSAKSVVKSGWPNWSVATSAIFSMETNIIAMRA